MNWKEVAFRLVVAALIGGIAWGSFVFGYEAGQRDAYIVMNAVLEDMLKNQEAKERDNNKINIAPLEQGNPIL